MAQQLVRPELVGLQLAFEHKAEQFEDKVINPRKLLAKADPTGTQYSAKMGLLRKQVRFSHSALSQLLYRLRIPAAFYRRNPKGLQARMFNYWKQHYVTPKDKEKSLLFRFNHANGQNHVRAVLSDMYGIMDDKYLFKVLLEILEEREDVSYRLLEWDDHITQLYVDFNDCTGEHNGITYTAGLCITNSETGHSAVWVEPIVHSMGTVFFNRRTLRLQGMDCRIIHRGKLARERVQPMVGQAKEIAQVGVTQLAELFSRRVTTADVLSVAENMDSLPSRFVQLLEEEWKDEEEIIKAEAARRILMLAQELPLFQRIQVQQDTGKFLGLFVNYKARFSELAEEINNESVRAREGSEYGAQQPEEAPQQAE